MSEKIGGGGGERKRDREVERCSWDVVASIEAHQDRTRWQEKRVLAPHKESKYPRETSLSVRDWGSWTRSDKRRSRWEPFCAVGADCQRAVVRSQVWYAGYCTFGSRFKNRLRLLFGPI